MAAHEAAVKERKCALIFENGRAEADNERLLQGN